MKVVLTAVGSAGDVFPSLGLALMLQQRGHTVVLLASGQFEPAARRLGVPFHAIGTAEEYRRLTANPDIFHPTRGFPAVARAVIDWTPRVYDAVQSELGLEPTLVVAHVLDVASRILQDEGKARVATLLLQPAVLRSEFQPPTMAGSADYARFPRWAKRLFWRIADLTVIDPPLQQPLNRLRARHGLPPVRHPFASWLFSPTRIIAMFPPWYAPPQPDWPPQLRFADFPLFDRTTPVPPDVERFLAAGEPPVAITLGTAMASGERELSIAVEACRRLGRRGLLLTTSPQAPRDLPPGIQRFDFAPLSLVLPRCAAIVHHGGVGTASAALAAGIPQVVVPLSQDQPDNAARIARLGVGTRVLPFRLRPANLAATLGRLLDSPTMHARCADLAARTRSVDGLALAADLVEELMPA